MTSSFGHSGHEMIKCRNVFTYALTNPVSIKLGSPSTTITDTLVNLVLSCYCGVSIFRKRVIQQLSERKENIMILILMVLIHVYLQFTYVQQWKRDHTGCICFVVPKSKFIRLYTPLFLLQLETHTVDNCDNCIMPPVCFAA